MDVLALANRIPGVIFGSNSDDDFSDRLNYRYTVALLVLFSIILTSRQYSSEVFFLICSNFKLSFIKLFYR